MSQGVTGVTGVNSGTKGMCTVADRGTGCTWGLCTGDEKENTGSDMVRQGIFIQTRVFRAIRVSTSSVKKNVKMWKLHLLTANVKQEYKIMNTFSNSFVT